MELDKTLQEFLKGYLGKTKVEQVSQETGHRAEDENQEHQEDRRDHSADQAEEIDPDQVPF